MNEGSGNNTNIVLIGMPGCGKSTIGRRLASQYGFDFIDSDIEFERIWGISPSDCIQQYGEAEFRKKETEVLQSFKCCERKVIATGGGVVTVPGNYDLLHGLGIVIYIKRRLKMLSVKGRPLSAGRGVEALYAERRPLYESFSDARVYNREVDKTVEEIMHIWSKKCDMK